MTKSGGRPAIYDWDKIRRAYEDGLSVDVISERYKVTKKTLQNRISAKKWGRVGGTSACIEDIKENLGKISYNTKDDPILQEIVIERLSTILEDNELIGNNRKLLKAFQSLVGRGIKEGMYSTAQDIKAGISSIKDIETVSNPRTNSTSLAIQNNVTNNNSLEQTGIKISFED